MKGQLGKGLEQDCQVDLMASLEKDELTKWQFQEMDITSW